MEAPPLLVGDVSLHRIDVTYSREFFKIVRDYITPLLFIFLSLEKNISFSLSILVYMENYWCV
jgi:hypothetical protein